jgi:hydrogenase maturation protein HypF
LFDAVASMLGVCHVNSYEAEAAMRLQALVAWQGKRLALTTGATLPLPLRREQNGFELDWLPMIAAMAGRLRGNEVQQQKRLLVIDFIEALVQGIAQVATQAGLKQVALSGGCFQNPMLLQRSCEHLKLLGFQPYWPQRIPVNDSGIAAGQVMALIKQQRV